MCYVYGSLWPKDDPMNKVVFPDRTWSRPPRTPSPPRKPSTKARYEQPDPGASTSQPQPTTNLGAHLPPRPDPPRRKEPKEPEPGDFDLNPPIWNLNRLRPRHHSPDPFARRSPLPEIRQTCFPSSLPINEDDDENKEMQQALYAPYSHQNDRDAPTEDPADKHHDHGSGLQPPELNEDALAEICDEKMVLGSSNSRNKRKKIPKLVLKMSKDDVVQKHQDAASEDTEEEEDYPNLTV